MALHFYYGSGSPVAWKVWLALEHLELPYELHVMSFQAGDLKTPAYLAINPRHQVPAIVDEGFALYESTAIIDYLDQRYGALWPRDPRLRAIGRRIETEADLYVRPRIAKLLEQTLGREAQDPAAIAEAKAAVAEELALIASAIVGPFALGDQLSAADFALYPHCGFLPRIDVRQPGHEARRLAPPTLATWMARIEALPYFAKTSPPHWRA
ncbi:MAG TPA: glutathione S-transferase family protein [Kofleriaceae bacterium]